MRTTRRSFVYVAAGLAALLLAALFIPAAPTTAAALDTPAVPVAFVTRDTAPAAPSDLIQLAQRDPAAVTRLGMERYRASVREYSCVFLKQERLDGGLTPVQEIEVRFRREPHSVFMIWKRNADGAKRALYVDHPEYVDGSGRKAAKVEPAGAVARLFVSEIMMAIDGSEARAASRRSIAEFGFAATVGLLDQINTQAAQAGVLDYKFSGAGEVDGRPTLVFTRRLPAAKSQNPWPDALLVMHVDQEWLLPTALYSYADAEGKELLGSYVTTRVRFNPGFDESAFRF